VAKPLGFKDFVSVDYTQDGDDQVAYNAKKRKKHIPTGNADEALDITQRLARKRSFKKNKAKIALGRKRAAKRMASMDVLKKRAQKQARNLVMKKLTKGIPKDELSLPRRQEIEKRLDKMKPKIDKIAKRLIPKVRKMEIERKKGPKKDEDD
jgi:hypothetical protein